MFFYAVFCVSGVLCTISPRREMVRILLQLLSHFSRVRLCATPWMAAHQAPPSLGFSRQEHWSGLPFPSPMHACMLSRFSRVRLCVTPWTAAHQAPLSMGFSRQEYWSGLPFPSPLAHTLGSKFFSQMLHQKSSTTVLGVYHNGLGKFFNMYMHKSRTRLSD